MRASMLGRLGAGSLVLIAGLVGCGGGKSSDKSDAAAVQTPLPCGPGSTIVTRKLPDSIGDGAMLVTSPPGDNRLFVVGQRGTIRIYDNEHLLAAPFLDITSQVTAGGELGLLGLAFHPHYAQNGQFFVWYTTTRGGSPYSDVLARYQVSASDPDRADPTETVVLAIPDPFGNHNGGMLEFGNDGLLYVGTGDGGSAGDPQRNGQNVNALLAKILRIDVDNKTAGKEYGIPGDNPFGNEVFIYGVRNPWRWSFDRATGDMWIGDVGQGRIEELDVLKAGEQRGANLGWSVFEGSGCCMTQGDRCVQSGSQQACTMTGMTFAVDNREHATGWNAIIGGQVYRGSCYSDLVGWYLYTDNGAGGLVKARLKPDGKLEIVDLQGNFPRSPASIHADARGELYETDTAGNVYHIEAGP